MPASDFCGTILRDWLPFVLFQTLGKLSKDLKNSVNKCLIKVVMAQGIWMFIFPDRENMEFGKQE